MAFPLTTPSGPIRLGTGTQSTVRSGRQRRGSADGLWGERRRINREVSVPHAWERLQAAGNFANLELAAATESGHPAERGAYVNELPFLDSDLYKWLEAIGWTLADPELTESTATELRERLSAAIALLRRVQAEDGYLDSHFQVRFPGERFVQLPWGHELYCAGHLIQAAVAVHRATGETELLDVARRFADLITASFGTGEGLVDGVCGHPEIETALVELYRETGESQLPGRGAVLHRPPRSRPARRRPVRPSVLPRSRPGPGRPGGDRPLRTPAVPAGRGGRPGDPRPASPRSARRRSDSGRRAPPPRPT